MKLVRQIKVRISLAMWQALTDIARRESRSLSGVVRLAVEEFLDRYWEERDQFKDGVARLVIEELGK